MNKNKILIFGVLIAASFLVQIMAQEPDSLNQSTQTLVEISASNESGSMTIHWRMPPRDSAFLYHIARKCGDPSFKQELSLSFRQKEFGQQSCRSNVLGAIMVDRSKADFVIDRSFTDKQGTHSISINLPAHQALGILKASFLVGDSRLKYQVMRFGFCKYQHQDVREDILTFLSEAFDQQDVMTRGEILFSMFAMDPHSPQTLIIIEKAKSLGGAGRVESFIRQAALDMKEYLDSGDRSLIEKYNVTL